MDWPVREILKAFTKTTSGTIISLVLNTITVKILAVLLGPSGVGLLSLLRQIYTTTLIAATMSGQTALVQGGASRNADSRVKYLRTVLILFLISGLSCALLLILLAPFLAKWVLDRTDNTGIGLVRLLALPVFLTVINGFFFGVLNIYRHLGRMAAIQIAAATVTALLAYPLALWVRQGYEQAIVGIVLLAPLLTFGLILIPIHELKLFGPLFSSLHTGLQWKMARDFYSFAGVTLITALLQSGILLLIRSWIVADSGLSGAGIFDAAWTLSMTYITLITTAFGTYYLPTLSSLELKQERVQLMQTMFRFTTILIVPMILGVVVLKPFILRLLFSAEFLPAIPLISWMLIGDYFKLTSWVKAYPMLAFAELRTFFWVELIFHLMFLVGAGVSIRIFNKMEGIAFTFTLMYVLYYIASTVYAHRRHSFLVERHSRLSWWIGLALIVVFSALTWQHTEVQWSIVLATSIVSFMYVFFSFRRDERSQVYRLLHSRLRQWQAA